MAVDSSAVDARLKKKEVNKGNFSEDIARLVLFIKILANFSDVFRVIERILVDLLAGFIEGFSTDSRPFFCNLDQFNHHLRLFPKINI